MEHLLQPSKPNSPLIEVPFLWGEKYDGQGFLRYPERLGWKAAVQQNHHQYLPGEEHEGNSEYAAAFMQQWLFFGLLIEVLRTYNVTVDPEDFLRFEDDGVFLTTAKLRTHLEKMQENNQKFLPEERKQRWSGALMHFEKAVKFARCAAHADDGHSAMMREDQALAITVLGVTLQDAVYYISQDLANFDAVPAHMAEAMLGFEAITNVGTRRQLLNNPNFCPSDVAILEKFLDAGSAYFASRIDRQSKLPRHHLGCSERVCVAYHANYESYEPKHVDKKCECAKLEINTAEITKVLSAGNVPAIKISIAADGSPSVAVVNAEDHKYVAVSHVWSDGLGNPDSNSLPSCQIARIHRLANGLTSDVGEATEKLGALSLDGSQASSSAGDVVIWIDTLCVPLERDANNLAVALLHKTYRGANAVLVLDAELEQTSMRAEWQELAIRIAISGWSKRLASLEAGFATKRLLFQFKESAVEIRRLIQEKRPESDDILRWRSDRTIYRLFSNRVPKYREKPDVTDLVASGDSLMFRKASKPEFEPVCLAMMMGLDVKNMLTTDSADERMKIFYSMLEEIPLNILYLMGPKLDNIDGFHWAPKSLMNANSNIRTRWRGRQLTGTGRLDPETHCLSFSLPGYVIKLNKGHSDVYFFVRDGEQGKIMFLVDQRRDKAAWAKVSELEELLLITESSGQHRGGFLASMEKESEEVIRARYLFPVEVSPLSDVGNSNVMDPDNFKGAMGVCTKKIPATQKWCIV